MARKLPTRLLVRGLAGVAALALLVAALTYVVSRGRAPTYTADAALQIVPSAQAAGNFVNEELLIQISNQYAELARSPAIATDAAERLGVDAATVDARADVTVPTAGVLGFEADAPEPPESTRTVEALMASFIARLEEQQRAGRREALAPLVAQIERIAREYEALADDSPLLGPVGAELDALRRRRGELLGEPLDAARVLRAPRTPTQASSPTPGRDALLAALLAGSLGSFLLLGASWWRERADSPEDFAAALGVPALGSLPVTRRRGDEASEAAESVLTNLENRLRRLDVRGPIVVTSAEAGAGKTFVTAQLADALAGAAQPVTVIDANLRRPALHEHFGVPRAPGLGDALLTADDTRLEPNATAVSVNGGVPGHEVVVVPAGRPADHPAERLRSARAQRLLGALAQGGATVLVDTPPALDVTDAAVLTRHAGAVVLVVDARRTRPADARRVLELLEPTGVPVVGFVYNRARSRRRGDDRRGGAA